MNAKKIRELSSQEIEKKIRDASNELVNLRVRKQVGQLEKPSEIRAIRRNIARMITILNDKQKQQAAAEVTA